MKEALEIKELSYKNVINKLNLKVKKNTFLTIAGSSNSGKTLLTRIILGQQLAEGFISVNGQTDLQKARKDVGLLFENANDIFICDNLREEIEYALENKDLDEIEINMRIKDISKELNINGILDSSLNQLSGGEKQLASLAVVLALKPSIIILDNSFTMLDGFEKEKIFAMLKKINKEENITIINFTNDLEESIYGDKLAVICDGKILAIDKTEKLLKNEKIFKQAKLDLPFMADLSLKLNYYDLVSDVILDVDRMVQELWK